MMPIRPSSSSSCSSYSSSYSSSSSSFQSRIRFLNSYNGEHVIKRAM